MSNIRPLFESLVGAMRGVFESKRVVRRGTVTRVVREGANGTSGRPMTAFFQIGDAAAEEVNVGNALAIQEGDEWEVLGTGDPADPQWRLGVRYRSAGPTMGADLGADRLSLVIPTYTDPADPLTRPIGVISEEQHNSLTGPNGSPMARGVVLFRSIVAGSYTVYGGAENISQVAVHVRQTTADNFSTTGDLPVFPSRPLHVVLGASLAAVGLSVAVNLPADVTIGDLISGYNVYWRLKDEIAIGTLTDTGGGSYELQFTSDGRGVESSTARAHAAGVKAELLCGRAIVENLEPGKPYRLYITAKTGYGVPQEKSNEVSFTAWQRVEIPAVASCTVEQREGGALVKWARPVDPDSGLPLTAPLYRVYRNTTATDVGATLVASDVSALQVFVQGSNGSGNYYGIQAYDTFGNASDVTWGSDTAAPPNPHFASYVVVPRDLAVEIQYTAANDSNSSRADQGFRQFVLYRADDTSGTNATIVKRMNADAIPYAPPLDKAYYYRLAAEDWASPPNISTATNNDQTWQIGIPNLYTLGVVNGNMNTPGATRTITGASITSGQSSLTASGAGFTNDDVGKLALIPGARSGGADLYTSIYKVTSTSQAEIINLAGATVNNVSIVVGGGPDNWQMGTFGRDNPAASEANWRNQKKVEYLTSGGINGNRVIKATMPAGTYTLNTNEPSVSFVNAPRQAYNPFRTSATLKMWVKGTSGVTIEYAFGMLLWQADLGYENYDADASSSLGSTVADGDWHEITRTITSTAFGAPGSYHSYRPYWAVRLAAGTYASDVEIWVDDFTVTIS